jgi:hypothetical protein
VRELYVASWSANARFLKIFVMTGILHQEMAAHYDLSPARLQYNLSTHLDIKDFGYHDLDSKALDEFLAPHIIKPTAFARADGPFFGVSLDQEHQPNMCFASSARHQSDEVTICSYLYALYITVNCLQSENTASYKLPRISENRHFVTFPEKRAI